MIDSGKLDVSFRNGKMVVKLPASVLFASGSAELSDGGKQALAEVAAVLKQMPDRRFTVGGHTDNVPIRTPRFPSNWELSTARAVEVTRLLIEAGMRPEVVGAAGYAEFDPVADNSTPEGRAQNRRIEIILMPTIPQSLQDMLQPGS